MFHLSLGVIQLGNGGANPTALYERSTLVPRYPSRRTPNLKAETNHKHQ
jgi:hypothetical protein